MIIKGLNLESLESKDLIKQIEDAGWHLIRVKGYHHHFKRDQPKELLTIPYYYKKELPQGTIEKILKQTGVKL